VTQPSKKSNSSGRTYGSGWALRATQKCAAAGVQESTPAGVSAFQQEPDQEQE